MRSAILAGSIVFVLAGSSSFAAEQPIVAVFRIADKTDIHLSAKVLDNLTEILAGQLGQGGVYQVVPPGDVQRALQEKKKESYKECYDQQCQIELGRDLAANKTLSTSIVKIGNVCTVNTALYDLKKMATEITSSAKGECKESRLQELIEKVSAEIRAYGVGKSGAGGFKEGKIGAKQEDWVVGGGEEVIVSFASKPSGAAVLLDGRILCQATPCNKSVSSGQHELSIQSEKYQVRKERVVLAAGSKIDWELSPNFGWLTVRSKPIGLDVKLNNETIGKTPIEKREVSPGGYEVLIVSSCHQEAGERIKIELGQERVISLEPQERQGAIKVTASDKDGNDLQADVLVDGKKIGATPGTFKVSICAKNVVIRHAKQGEKSQAITLKEKEVVTVAAVLDQNVAGLEWVYSSFAKLEFAKSEVTVAQFEQCIKAKGCDNTKERQGYWGQSDDKNCNMGYSDRVNHPMNCVNMFAAEAFCKWAKGRLPTALEWQAEASAGGTRQYPWGDQETTCDYAVFDEGCGRKTTWPVCSKPKGNSASGLCDMGGNAMEWTSSEGVDQNGIEGWFLCGGSFRYTWAEGMKASYRTTAKPVHVRDDGGIRCVREAKP